MSRGGGRHASPARGFFEAVRVCACWIPPPPPRCMVRWWKPFRLFTRYSVGRRVPIAERACGVRTASNAALEVRSSCDVELKAGIEPAVGHWRVGLRPRGRAYPAEQEAEAARRCTHVVAHPVSHPHCCLFAVRHLVAAGRPGAGIEFDGGRVAHRPRGQTSPAEREAARRCRHVAHPVPHPH